MLDAPRQLAGALDGDGEGFPLGAPLEFPREFAAAIERGDVVVFHYPRDPEKSYIKRVIAEPGDELRIDDGRTYINGRLLPEPYVPRRFHDSRSQDVMVIQADQYFVMGDHRSISSDSRDFGPVPRDLIYGKAAFVYWPAEDMGIIH